MQLYLYNTLSNYTTSETDYYVTLPECSADFCMGVHTLVLIYSWYTDAIMCTGILTKCSTGQVGNSVQK